MAITENFESHTVLTAQKLNSLVSQANAYVHEIDVKKPDTVDISNYISEGDELPLGCYYVYFGNPTHTLAGRYTDTYFIAICISHWEHAHTLAVYTKNAQNKYIYYETFRTDQALTAFEKYIAAISGTSVLANHVTMNSGATVEEEVSGLSSDVEGGTIDHSDTEIHAYLDNSGSPVSQNASDCTDFIPVSEGDTFMYGGITGEALSPVYGYSNNSGSNPQVLVRHTGNTYKETEFAIPSGISYIRAWSRNSSHSSTPSSLKLIDITRAVGLKQRVETLESKFSNLENNVNGGQGIDYSDTDIHAYINNSGQLVSSNTSDCTDYIAVEEGETFKYGGITGEGLSPVYGYSDTSGNGYQALASPTGDTYKEKDFTVPSGVNYIKAWSRNSSHSSTPSSLKLIDITNSTGLEQRVESLESALVDVEGEIIDYSETNIHAYLNNGEAVSSNTSDCTDYIAVEEGETFKYGGVTGEALSPVYGYSNNSGGNPQALVNPTGNTYKETEIAIPNSVIFN